MLILLIGPKGSGKSHIGRLLESSLGVHFFHVESLWIAYHADCREAETEPTIAEGIRRVHPFIEEALQQHEHVCIETTGASPEILESLLSLDDTTPLLTVRITAPLDTCLHRIATRDQQHQIPMEEEMIRKVYQLSTELGLECDVVIENDELSDEEIVGVFRESLRPGA